MTEQTLPHPQTDETLVYISEADYMEHYAEHHYERVEGRLLKMSPIHETHYHISGYLALLFKFYFTFRPNGQIREDPFVMKLSILNTQRQPDIQVILGDNQKHLTPTFMDGPADICVEVVSPGSVEEDRGKKFTQYEKAGIPEYWIVDPIRYEGLFYRLNDEGIYVPQPLDQDQHYQTPLLPDFNIHVPTLWRNPLPNPIQTLEAVRQMLKQ